MLAIIAQAGARSRLSGTPHRSPRDVLTEFCAMDAEGTRLTTDGWYEAGQLFIKPRPPYRDNIIVIKDFGVSLPSMNGKRALLYVEYLYLGQLDSRLRFSRLPDLPPGPAKVRIDYHLVLTDKHWRAARDGGTATEERGPVEWRIEDSEPQPHITVETAIHYLIGLRDTAVDESARKSADSAIAVLKLQK